MNIIRRYTVKAPFGNNQTKLKNKLLKCGSGICDGCNKTLDSGVRGNVILDHIIPIALGGDEFSEENAQLLCPGCDKEKTIIDRQIILFFKKIRIINKDHLNSWRIYVPRRDISKLYLSLYAYSVLSKRFDSEWLNRD